MQRSGVDEKYPLTPDFAAFLATTPPADRTGPVLRFYWPGRPQRRYRKEADVGRVISAIGKAAGVVVNDHPQKFESAHDLRRSFGVRWAMIVMPVVLQRLMRHASTETTLRYYVGQATKDVQDAAWRAWEALPQNANVNTTADTTPDPKKRKKP